MKKYFSIFFFIFINTESLASDKDNIIKTLNNINNLTFKFEQNINGKIEDGKCTLQYPKKIYCKYNLGNQKILVSDGKTLIIKTSSSYYSYPLERTPLNLILDKKYLIKKIENLKERIIENKYINYNFVENDNEINIFFDKKNYNLIGWQTLDIYKNLSITFLHSILKNKKLKENFFKIPEKE